jgi:hypothetical protein
MLDGTRRSPGHFGVRGTLGLLAAIVVLMLAGAVAHARGGVLVIGTPAVSRGDAVALDVGRAIERGHGRLAACFDRAGRRALVDGTLTVVFTIDARGHGKLFATRGLTSAAASSCVRAVLGRVKFPPATGQVTVDLVYDPKGITDATADAAFRRGRDEDDPIAPTGPRLRVNLRQVSQVGGGLDPAEIRRWLRKHDPQLASCYHARPAAGSKVMVHFVISGDTGRVTQASATGPHDAILELCLEKALAAIPYPIPADRLAITAGYELSFGETPSPEVPAPPSPATSPTRAVDPEVETMGGYGLAIEGQGGGGVGLASVGGRGIKLGHGPGRPPPVKLGKVVSKGSLDQVIILRRLREKQQSAANCFTMELLNTPKLAGKVEVTFTISVSGAVGDVTATGLGNDKVERCLVGVVSAIVMPAPPDKDLVRVRTSYTFRP